MSHPEKMVNAFLKTGFTITYEGTTIADMDILNNIYDLEGNFCEWTAEVFAEELDDGVVGRGSCSYLSQSGAYLPASWHQPYYPFFPNEYTTTRTSLYL